jgi:hypothetical protein
VGENRRANIFFSLVRVAVSKNILLWDVAWFGSGTCTCVGARVEELDDNATDRMASQYKQGVKLIDHASKPNLRHL